MFSVEDNPFGGSADAVSVSPASAAFELTGTIGTISVDMTSLGSLAIGEGFSTGPACTASFRENCAFLAILCRLADRFTPSSGRSLLARVSIGATEVFEDSRGSMDVDCRR